MHDFWTQLKTEPSEKADSYFQVYSKGLDLLLTKNLILVIASAYMLLGAEEALLLPPLIPARLHILWAIRLWEGQRGIWGGRRTTRWKIWSKSINTYDVKVQQMLTSAVLYILIPACTFLLSRQECSSVCYLFFFWPFHPNTVDILQRSENNVGKYSCSKSHEWNAMNSVGDVNFKSPTLLRMAVSRFLFRLAFSDWDRRDWKGCDEGEEEEDEEEEGGEHSLRLHVRHTPDSGLTHLPQVGLHMTWRYRDEGQIFTPGGFFCCFVVFL